MRWTPRGRSRNLEDRRGQRGAGGFPGGGPPGGGRMRVGLGGLVVLIVLSLVLQTDLVSMLGVAGGGGALAPAPASAPAPIADASEEDMVEFVSFVLDDAQALWTQLFANSGARYEEATLVIFRDAVQSECGAASSATGPFYCPADRTVYLDLGFFDELHRRFGAPGDFAQAYVLAHEIGHHVQRLLGTEAEVRRAQQVRPGQANGLSVLLELQADCYAGVWAHETAQRDLLERGDLDEALGAASAVGDDRLQAQSGGRVSPETWTHGSAEQRARWFRVGYASGNPNDCDTFSGR